MEIPVYLADVRNLLRQFASERENTFHAFKLVWKSLGFSKIHEYDEESSEFLQLLYTSTLSFFWVNKSTKVRLGALYSLYLLFETQHITPKIKIVIPIGIWEELVHFMKEIVIPQKIADAYHIFHKMKNNGSFCFSAFFPDTHMTPNPCGYEISFHTEMVNLDCLSGTLDISLVQEMEKEYLGMKEKYANEHADGETSFPVPVDLTFASNLQQEMESHYKKRMTENLSRTIHIQGISKPIVSEPRNVKAKSKPGRPPAAMSKKRRMQGEEEIRDISIESMEELPPSESGLIQDMPSLDDSRQELSSEEDLFAEELEKKLLEDASQSHEP